MIETWALWFLGPTLTVVAGLVCFIMGIAVAGCASALIIGWVSRHLVSACSGRGL